MMQQDCRRPAALLIGGDVALAVLLTEAVVTAGAVFASPAVGRCTHCCHDDSVGESNNKRAGVKGKYIYPIDLFCTKQF